MVTDTGILILTFYLFALFAFLGLAAFVRSAFGILAGIAATFMAFQVGSMTGDSVLLILMLTFAILVFVVTIVGIARETKESGP